MTQTDTSDVLIDCQSVWKVFGDRSREAIGAIAAAGGKVIAGGCLVDRSNGAADIGVPLYPLIRLDVPTYSADRLPQDLAALPAVKPGSRAAA